MEPNCILEGKTVEKTERLYDRDAYLTSFCSEVLACEERGGVLRAALAATAFYPEGGGQPADRGALGGARVWTCTRRTA